METGGAVNFNPDRIADGFGGWFELKSGTVKTGLSLPLLDNGGNEVDDEERAVEVESKATVLGAGRMPVPKSSVVLVTTEGACMYTS